MSVDRFRRNLEIIEERHFQELDDLLRFLTKRLKQTLSGYLFMVLFGPPVRKWVRSRLTEQYRLLIRLVTEHPDIPSEDLIREHLDALLKTELTVLVVHRRHERFEELRQAIAASYVDILDSIRSLALAENKTTDPSDHLPESGEFQDSYDSLVFATFPNRSEALQILSKVHESSSRVIRLLEDHPSFLIGPPFLKNFGLMIIGLGYEHAQIVMQEVIDRIYSNPSESSSSGKS